MKLHITRESNSTDKQYVRNGLIQFNAKHFPDHLKSRYEEVNLFIKNEEGQVCGGVVGEICWNWLEVHYLYVDEELRKQGYGSKLIAEVEQIARDKKCDFIKLDTLSFQALDFYKRHGFEVYGSIENAGTHTHYYMKKDLQ
ncbi:GNAT family N-acetyltransferase [Paenibacillus sp. UMB4589-SE434]|uniref:GNAT family N-acetyltransferase n=1 Tax=Paenibacillus sp. UMB4589-SE434 TaxID=3046314 RepID=UPI0025513BE7|nr:GNAT family N-acetyltransferase [Paenibacillus sp. UMB4589-SE434]MDK8181768.1 GNAT family N-acetyltransferase [Paenibacillus sp. UMB4589-SE434]